MIFDTGGRVSIVSSVVSREPAKRKRGVWGSRVLSTRLCKAGSRRRPFYNQLVSLFKKLPTEVALQRPSARGRSGWPE